MLKSYVITATHGKHEQNLPHDLYVLNRERYHMNERERQLQDVIFKVKNYPDDVIPNLVFYAICKECGISPDSITNAEMTRIQNAIKDQTLKILKIFDIINT